MKRVWAAAPLAALVIITIAAIIALLQPGERQTLSQEGLIGRPIPSFALAPVGSQETLTSERFAGRAYVVNFFASWCAPCLDEHPLLMELRAAGTTILGVAYKDEAAKAARFLARHGDPYAAVGLDPAGRYGLEIGVAGVPETFVIDADGRIAALHRGPLTEEIVRTRIVPALEAGR